MNNFIKTVLITIIFSLNAVYEIKAQSFLWVNGQNHSFIMNPDMTVFISHADLQGNTVVSDMHLYKLYYGQNLYGDVSLKKHSSSGILIFSKILTGKISITGIQTDNAGNLYVSGIFMDTLTIDPVNKILNTGSGFNLNYFLIKLNSEGNFVWSKNINVIYGENYSIDDIKINNNFLYAGILDFNLGYVKKFDLNGNEIMSIIHYPVRGISGIDIDKNGNIFSAGSCGNGNINFGGQNQNAPHAYNVYIAKFNSMGANVWTKFIQDITFSNTDIECDKSNNLIACGDLNGAFFFGNIQAQGGQWVYDFFLTKINPAGEFLWLKEVPATATITGDASKGKTNSIAVDKDDNIYMTGFFRGTVDFGKNVSVSTSGYMDILILKYDKNGNPVYGKKAGGSGMNRGDCISLDKYSGVYVSGNYSSNAVFDSIIAAGSGSINSFIAKLSSDNPYSVFNLKVIIEGYYDNSLDEMRMNDTLHVRLRNSASPYNETDYSKSTLNGNTFTGEFYFHNAEAGEYYIQVNHRNSIETWSANPVHFEKGHTTDYDLTVSKQNAYGNNLIQVNDSPDRFGLFSGDVNQDGIVDASDMTDIDNDALNFMNGYIPTDVTGDGITDAADAAAADNNAAQFVGKIIP